MPSSPKVISFGSVNIDEFFHVPHFVRPGETLLSNSLTSRFGGKGANQAVSLAKAGSHTFQGGCVGEDGKAHLDYMKEMGVDVSLVKVSAEEKTGRAIIQVTEEGENSIILFGGANQIITLEDAKACLGHFTEGDCIVMQNEINHGPEILELAKACGMTTILNPSPTPKHMLFNLRSVDALVVNEVEAADLYAQLHSSPLEPFDAEKAARALIPHLSPNAILLLTLGPLGVLALHKDVLIQLPAAKAKVVDTTGAGDTFLGYFTTVLLQGGWSASSSLSADAASDLLRKAVTYGLNASAECIETSGAMNSIPSMEKVHARVSHQG